MKNTIRNNILLIIGFSVSASAWAKLEKLPVLEYSQETQSEQNPIYIKADKLDSEGNKKVTYSGDVTVIQGERQLTADKAILDKPNNKITAHGKVTYSDSQINVQSNYLETNTKTQDTEIKNAKYQLACQAGRGDAYRVYRDGKKIYRLKDGTFTTCPVNDNSWKLSASSIIRDENSPYLDLKNPRFEVLDVPIFYLPWLRVPVNKQRLTGFLFPSVHYNSTNGLELITPFYWNIAPNYDLTFTPRFMNSRGLELNTKFRYLNDFGLGSLTFEGMQEDRRHKALGSRWGYNWTHSGVYKENWKFDIDYSRVSYNDYFSDLSSQLGSREDNQLLQTGSVQYRTNKWDLSVALKDFQVLTNNIKPYKLAPQIAFNYYPTISNNGMQFNLNGELSRFKIDDKNKPSADRLHLEPSISFPILSTWWNMNTEVKLYATYYNQYDYSNNVTLDKNLDSHVTRYIPSIKWESGLVFERDFTLANLNYKQTLEPKIQYLYIPEKSQNNIFQPYNYKNGGYDTTLMQTDYYGLFRDQKYSSIDYIAPANQLSIGATTRFYDNLNRERMNLSVGQILFFRQDKLENGENSPTTSAWAVESDFNYNDWLYFHAGLQYDTHLSSAQVANTTIELRKNATNYLQLSYNYVDKDYLEQTVDYNNSTSGVVLLEDDLGQLGFNAAYDLNSKFNLRGGYYMDVNEGIMLEGYSQVVYSVDCWAVALGYSKYLLSRSNITTEPEKYEDSISLSFYLRGMSSLPSFADGENLYRTLGYRSSFNLNK